MWSLPPVLIIHLKRFHFDGKRLHKITKLVNFPIEDLHLATGQEEVLELEEGEGPASASLAAAGYRLFGVLNHSGTLGSGHYFSYCRKASDSSGEGGNAWFEFNDSFCAEVDPARVVSSKAYVLFYASQNITDLDYLSNVIQKSKSRCTVM